MRSQAIRTKPDYQSHTMRVGGWLNGRMSYLHISDKYGNCIGTIGGQKLYRLAKAIVRQFEGDKK